MSTPFLLFTLTGILSRHGPCGNARGPKGWQNDARTCAGNWLQRTICQRRSEAEARTWAIDSQISRFDCGQNRCLQTRQCCAYLTYSAAWADSALDSSEPVDSKQSPSPKSNPTAEPSSPNTGQTSHATATSATLQQLDWLPMESESMPSAEDGPAKTYRWPVRALVLQAREADSTANTFDSFTAPITGATSRSAALLRA